MGKNGNIWALINIVFDEFKNIYKKRLPDISHCQVADKSLLFNTVMIKFVILLVYIYFFFSANLHILILVELMLKVVFISLVILSTIRVEIYSPSRANMKNKQVKTVLYLFLDFEWRFDDKVGQMRFSVVSNL